MTPNQQIPLKGKWSIRHARYGSMDAGAISVGYNNYRVIDVTVNVFEIKSISKAIRNNVDNSGGPVVHVGEFIYVCDDNLNATDLTLFVENLREKIKWANMFAHTIKDTEDQE